MIIAPINYYQKLRGMDCIEFLHRIYGLEDDSWCFLIFLNKNLQNFP